jgi:hypothetical protein
MIILIHIHLNTWYLTMEHFKPCDEQKNVIDTHNRYTFLCFTVETIKKK